MSLTKIVIFVAIFLTGVFVSGQARAASLDTEEQAFIDLLNDYRKSQKLMELKVTKPLLNGADFFAEDFADHPNNSDVNIHIDTTGDAPEERGDKYGYYFLAENMGWGYETGQAMFDAWKASEGHKANMLNSGARTVGVARYNKPGATKDGVATEWFWIMDVSDEGVERLAGNNLTDSEMYSDDYRKLTVNIKKWSKNANKYKNGRWAEVKIYDKATGRLLDHDIGDKKGNCKVYFLGSRKNIIVKIAKFKGNKTSKFTISGKKVKSKKYDLKKNKKISVKIK